MTLDEVCAKLEGVQGFGDRRKSHCPGHEDRVASLSLREVDGGKILLSCMAGCDVKDLVKKLGLAWSDLAGDGKAGKETHRYPYVSAGGDVLYEKVRYEPKTFRIIPSGYRGERVPFLLPEMLAAQSRRVIWVEGEKSALRLRDLGFVATTAGGATSWTQDMAKWFKDRHVTILPDNDAPGKQHAYGVGVALSLVAKSVSILELENLPPKGDVVDWLDKDNGRCADDLRVALRGAVPLDLSALQSFDTIPAADTTWLWFPRIAKGAVTLVFGKAGIGKSTIMLDVLARLSRGDAMPNSVEKQPETKSVIVGIEGPVERTREVLVASGAKLENVAVVRSDRLPERGKGPLEQIDYLESAMRKFGASVLFVDNVTEAMVSDTDTNNEFSVRQALRRVTEFAERTGYAVIMVSHPKKGATFGDVNEAITGSQAFTNLPRTTIFVAPCMVDGERTGTCAVAVAKSNLYPAEQINTLEYELTSTETGYREGHAITTAPRVAWRGVIYKSAQELLEDMRPPKQAPEAKGEPPMVAAADRWMEEYVRTVMPVNGATWSEILELAAGSVTEGALKKVRGKHIRATGKAGQVRYFPRDSDTQPEQTSHVAETSKTEAAPAQPASERLAVFMASESVDEFIDRKVGGE